MKNMQIPWTQSFFVFQRRDTFNGFYLLIKRRTEWLKERQFHMRGLYKSRRRADHGVHQDKWPYCMRSLLSCICTELTLPQPLSDLLCFTDCCASYLYDAPWWMEFWHDYRRLNTELAGVTRWLMTEGRTLTVFLLPSNGEKSPSLSWWPSIARPLRHEIQAVGPILMRKNGRNLVFLQSNRFRPGLEVLQMI